MKEVLRLGYSESDLLFTFFIVNYSSKKIDFGEDNFIRDHTNNILNWFYSTSGFYDKSIKEININCFYSENFIIYMKKIISIIKTCSVCLLNIHGHYQKYASYFSEFIEFLDNKVFCEIWYDEKEKFYSLYHINYDINTFIENKKILIINPLSELMKSQFMSGNIYKINNVEKLPSIKEIFNIINKNTFFNDGPGDFIIENYYNICLEIDNMNKEHDFDTVIISCGAYSCLLANYIFTSYNKAVFVIGGELNNMFGIKNQRFLEHNPTAIYNEFWIEVPNELKPEGYKKIENGCYW